MKRGLDIVASFCGLLLLSPLFLIVAVAIKIDSRGTIFFRQERIGKGFRPFWIYKFRTMVENASQRGGILTSGADPRITRVGKILRQTKIDELAQLINVLRGDMSLVGPRPEVRPYVELFRKNYETILTVRPGITDLASLKYRDESALLSTATNPEEMYVRHILPDKLLLAEEYIRRSSLAFDVVLILKTLGKLMVGKNSGQNGDCETSPPSYREPPGMKLRLLFVIDEDLYFCKHRLELARAARDAGFEVLVSTLVQHHGKQIEEEGFKLFPIQLRRGLQSPLHDFASLMELIRLYRRERPDIVHHVALKQVLIGAIAARLVGVPMMTNAITGLGFLFHSGTRRAKVILSLIRPVLRWALAHPRSRVILENEDDCEDLINAGIIKRSRAVVIHGAGVNVSQFRPSPEPDGVPVVLLASRMLWDKGVGEFVEAARLLKRNSIRSRCVLVGMIDKESPSTIAESQLLRWQEEGVIEWWGHRDDMADVFASSHIVVLPSYAEGLPMVLLEGAASARPLIATRVRGCQEIVRNGENGLLVPPQNSHLLAQAIITLLQDKPLRATMGARGREIVMDEFTAERVAEETMTVYGQLLGNGYSPSLARGGLSEIMED